MSFIGKALYQIWHRPVGAVGSVFAAGGPWEVALNNRGRSAMLEAAENLPLLENQTGAPLELHLLTGRRFWDMSAFCLWSFALQSHRPLIPVIYDDGTITAEVRAPLLRVFPAARFVSQQETIARLDQYLPVEKYPVLRERWVNYPNIRKLLDPHVGRSGWKLVVDSDLLFFREPRFLINWLDQPDRPLHALDCETSYGYTRELMQQLAGKPVADLVNVGLTGLNGREIDWDQLEHWCRILIEKEKTSYFLEQAVIAMMVADRECTIAPASDYVTKPLRPEATDCRAVMHHYVANSKKWYFQSNWKRAQTV